MKLYRDRPKNLLTEKQFKEGHFNEEQIFNMLLEGRFQNEFIEICDHCSKTTTLAEILNYFINYIQKDKELFYSYLDYFDIEEYEIKDDEIIKALKEN